MKNLILVFLMIFGISVFGHGVHDSGHAQPKKGGVLRSLETIHLELVHIKNNIKIFIYDKSPNLKPLDPKNYPTSAKILLPRGKGSQNVNLKAGVDHWEMSYDIKDIHRFDLEFQIEQGGHKDILKFTIEPKK